VKVAKVQAPLTGIFYHAPSEGEAPYVTVGQTVSSGDVVGLVESMKLFVEVRAEVRGVVKATLAANGVQVTKDQDLVAIEVT
jgi:acetyl-CoA carboxylase biotin carboxyl carrier protein